MPDLQNYPTLALELMELTASADTSYTLRAEDVKQTSFRLDGVLVPSDLPEQARQLDDLLWTFW